MKQDIQETLSYIKEAMSLIPENTAAAMLVRHAERPRGHKNDVLLTPQGLKDAFSAGELMKGRVSSLLYSPIERCCQTAYQMKKGSGADASPETWKALKYHVYVTDPEAAQKTLKRLVERGPHPRFYPRFVDEMSRSGMTPPYPGFKPPIVAASELMHRLISCADSNICAGVTHDWLINVAVSYISGDVIDKSEFAGFLDALFIWEQNNDWMFYYKGRHGRCAEDFCRVFTSPQNA